MSKDPYDVIGVARGCSDEELKAAYRAKAKELHPDTGGDEEAFKELQAAKDAMDKEKHLPQSFWENVVGPWGFGFDPASFIRAAPLSMPMGEAVSLKVLVDLPSIYAGEQGKEYEFTIPTWDLCRECFGMGGESGVCPTCNGKGLIESTAVAGNWRSSVVYTCNTCQGRPDLYLAKPCSACRGTGLVESTGVMSCVPFEKAGDLWERHTFIPDKGKPPVRAGLYPSWKPGGIHVVFAAALPEECFIWTKRRLAVRYKMPTLKEFLLGGVLTRPAHPWLHLEVGKPWRTDHVVAEGAGPFGTDVVVQILPPDLEEIPPDQRTLLERLEV